MDTYQTIDDTYKRSMAEAITQGTKRMAELGQVNNIDPSVLAVLASRESNNGKYSANIFQIGPANQQWFFKNQAKQLGVDAEHIKEPVNQVMMAYKVADGMFADAQQRGIDTTNLRNAVGVWSFGPTGYQKIKAGQAPSKEFLQKYHPQVLRYMAKHGLELTADGIDRALNAEVEHYKQALGMIDREDTIVQATVEPVETDNYTASVDSSKDIDQYLTKPPEGDMEFSALRTGVGTAVGMLAGVLTGRVSTAARLIRGLTGAALGATGSIAAQGIGIVANKAGVPKAWAEVGSYLLEPLTMRTVLGPLSKIKAPQMMDEILKQEKGAQDQFHAMHDLEESLAKAKGLKLKLDKSSPLRTLTDKNGYVAADKALMADPKYWEQVTELLTLPEEVRLNLSQRMNLKAAPILSSSDTILRSLNFKPAEIIADTVTMKYNIKNKIMRDFLTPLTEIQNRYKTFTPVEKTQVATMLDSIVDLDGVVRWERVDRFKAALEKLETGTARNINKAKSTQAFNTITRLRSRVNILDQIDREGPVVQASKELRQYSKSMAGYIDQANVYIIDKGKVQKFQAKDFYMPHIIKPGLKLAANETEKITRAYMDKFGMTRGAARLLVDEDMGFGKSAATYFSHAKKRLSNLPDLDVIVTDPFEAFTYYTLGMSDAVSNFKAYGPGFYKVKKLIAIAKTYNKPELNGYLDLVLKDIEGKTFGDSTAVLNRTMANMRALTTALKLPLAVIPNLTQSHLTIALSGFKNFGKAVKAVMTNAESRKMLQEITPVLRSNVEKLLEDVSAGSGGWQQRAAKFVLTKTGFSWVETKLNRSIANVTGWMQLNDITKKIRAGEALPSEVRRLRKAGIDLDELLTSGVNRDMQFKFGDMVEHETQFGTRSSDIPLKWRTPTGKFITQFKTFAFNQAKLVKNLMKQAATDYWQTGNVRSFDPLLRLAYLMPTLGWVVLKFRGTVMNQQVSANDLEGLLSAYAAAGGLGIVSDTITSATYGPGVLISSIAGPNISTIGEVLSRTVNAFKTGNVAKNTIRGVKRLSPIGKMAVNWSGLDAKLPKLPKLKGLEKLPKLNAD